MRSVVVQVDALHQKRPPRLLARWQTALGERTMAQFPTARSVTNKARFDVAPARECKKGVAVYWRLEARNGLAHQQRLFLPMTSHELLRGESAEQR